MRVLLSLLVISFILSLARCKDLRTNFCPLFKKFENRTTELKDALEGLNISLAITEDFDESNPLMSILILDEISRRARFWYQIYELEGPKVNETWTDVLEGTAEKYDVAADWWVQSVARIGLGLRFPEPWYNADSILVSRQGADSVKFDFSAFNKPFSLGLRMLIFGTILCTGLVYYFLDFIQAHQPSSQTFSNASSCIYTSFLSFTRSRIEYEPKSRASRILTISLAFLNLVLISAYTANLTRFFIRKSRPTIPINDVEDVIKNNYLVCIPQGFQNAIYFKNTYPKARVLEVANLGSTADQDVLLSVGMGRCDVGLVTMEGFLTYKQGATFNQNCDIEWIGRRVFEAGASFCIKDSKKYCSSLLHQVLDYYLIQMKEEGKIDEIMSIQRSKISSKTCGSFSKSARGIETSSLQVINMGGAFLLHLLLMFTAIIIAAYDYYKLPYEQKNQVRQKIKSIFTNCKSNSDSFPNISDSTSSDTFVQCFYSNHNLDSCALICNLIEQDNQFILQMKDMLSQQKRNIFSHLDMQNRELVQNIQQRDQKHSTKED